MLINDYQFGRITIDGDTYTRDVIIFPDRVLPSWRRADGHRLTPDDLVEVLKDKPEVLIIGTGRSGQMSVPSETIVFLKSRGIEVFSYRTGDAVNLYNNIPKCHRIVAVLHLTC